MGINSGPEIMNAIVALKGLGVKLERTSSVDARALDSEPAMGVFGCTVGATGRGRQIASERSVQADPSQEQPGTVQGMHANQGWFTALESLSYE